MVPGSNVRIILSASEILRLADNIVAKSKEIHDAVASVPPDKVLYILMFYINKCDIILAS